MHMCVYILQSVKLNASHLITISLSILLRSNQPISSKKKKRRRRRRMVMMMESIYKGVGHEKDEATGLVLQRSVKKFLFGSTWEEKEGAIVEITRIAREGGRVRRKALAGLGIIPCLVSMIDSDDQRRRRLAVLALLELANGTYTNRALMVESGILVKLKNQITITTTSKDQSTTIELLHLLLSISSLDKTQFSICFSSGTTLIPILCQTLAADTAADEVRLICLTTLSNISTKLENIKPLVSNGLIPILLNLCTNPSSILTERALTILGSMVVTETGRKAVQADPAVPKCFVKVLEWDHDQQKCQELAAYVLMLLAYKDAVERRRMAEAGVVPTLLGVALLGSEIGRRRALMLLDWFKGERMVRVHSGPQVVRDVGIEEGNGVDESSSVELEGKKKHRKEMKKMVKQSLDKNMEVIMRRGCSCNNFKF